VANRLAAPKPGIRWESAGVASGIARQQVKIGLVYDCLYPNSLGGAERWYRNLGDRLQGSHSVTYLTRRQWGPEGPQTSFRTLAVAPGGELYTKSGRRRIWPALRFGIGVFVHLVRHGRGYDAVHLASFPYFSVIGAALALWLCRSPARLVVDWHEVWSREYWQAYLGSLAGRIGFAVQGMCARLPRHSFTFSRAAEQRLHEHGHRAPVTRLTGEYAADERLRQELLSGRASKSPYVVFAGRHIPEKHVPAIPAAIAEARKKVPDLRCVILGDGPDTESTRVRVRELGLEGVVEMRGRVPPDEVLRTVAAASCLLHPSEREGYGLVVVEAFSVGTPVVLVEGPENAATELAEPDVNALVVDSTEPDVLGGAIVEVLERGEDLRRSALRWYEEHATALSLESSLSRVKETLTARRVLHVLPHPGGGGEEYVRLLEAMEGFRFERMFLTRTKSPLAAAAKVPAVARRARRCDLMQVHGDAASIVCLPVLGRRPSVLTTHGLHLLRRSSGLRGALVQRGIKVAVARSVATICNSAADCDELAEVVGSAERLTSIPNGIEIPASIASDEREFQRRDLGLDSSDVAVLWAGALEAYKDPLTFVRAITAAGPPVMGVMAGDGSMRSEIESHAGGRLRILGHRDDLDHILPACEVFAITSEREGVSLALLEAMAHRLPVVVSDYRANADVVGEDGIVFPLGEADALAAALLRLAASSELRDELGGRGRQRVEQLYDARRMVEATRRLYQRVVPD
jgi:glycosyltransferase involved in cell wall biosynthesis